MGTIIQICRAISSQLRHISTTGKFLNSKLNISSRYPHNMANVETLTAEIGLPVLGTPANFNCFRVLASLLQRRRSTEANQTLHDLWSSPGLVHYIYVFGGFCRLMEFWHVQNPLCVQVCVLVYWQRYCMALQQLASAKLCGVV